MSGAVCATMDVRPRGFLAILLSSVALGIVACTAPHRGPDLVRVIEKAAPAVVAIGDDRGLVGSGFRIEAPSIIITAGHLLSTQRGNAFVMWNERKWPVRVLRNEPDHDLAILEVDASAPIPGLRLEDVEHSPRVGEWIIVLGRPFGAGTTATVGIVSAAPGAVLEPAVLRDRIQLNAAINPGNSGGPVVNLHGRVIGIANATVPGGSGLGFAVPVGALKRLLSQ